MACNLSRKDTRDIQRRGLIRQIHLQRHWLGGMELHPAPAALLSQQPLHSTRTFVRQGRTLFPTSRCYEHRAAPSSMYDAQRLGRSRSGYSQNPASASASAAHHDKA